MNYLISGDTITCAKCGQTSHNPNDVKNRYCGHCHLFLDENPPAPMKSCASLVEAAGELHEVAKANAMTPRQATERIMQHLTTGIPPDESALYRHCEHHGVAVTLRLSIMAVSRGRAFVLSIYDPRGPLLDESFAREVAEFVLPGATMVPQDKVVVRPSRIFVRFELTQTTHN